MGRAPRRTGARGIDDEGYVVFEHVGRDVSAPDQEAASAGARVCPVAALLVRADA
ncbi:hypothetical protein [Streptomyces sp. HC307]|uniref:hypothetical protein n=1 Tax=Streptomyces flavusporus TaxID=3385496 RepID=UPI0039173B69